MLTIRKVQIDVIQESARKRLTTRIATCLRMHWTADFEEYGTEYCVQLIERAIDRANGYCFFTDREIARFVNLVFFLGEDFESDPEFPWAASILGNSKLNNRHKLDLLLQRGLAIYHASHELSDESVG